MMPVRFLPYANVGQMRFANLRNPAPYQYPLAYRFQTDGNTLQMVVLNYANGLSMRTPPFAVTSAAGQSFQTEVFQAILLSSGSPDFMQNFRGVTYFNFNLDAKTEVKIDSEQANMNGVTSGFLQNSTIYCLDDLEGLYSVTRNFSVALQCPNDQLGLGSYLMTRYISKNYDFVWGQSSSIDRSGNQDDPDDYLLANITHSFRLNNSDEFLFLYHNGITVVNTRDTAKIVLFIDLQDDHSFTPIDFRKCMSLSENTQINDTLELELLCLISSNYYLYNFTLDVGYLRNCSLDAPKRVTFNATKWLILNILMEQFFSKSLKTFYLGKMLYVLDSIVLENYNNKPFLNIYQIVMLPLSVPRSADLVMVWSSLSIDQFSEFNITEFAVVKAAADEEGLRQYVLNVVMQNTERFVNAYTATYVTIYDDGDGERPIITSSNAIYYGDLFMSNVKIFSISPKIYLYGFTKDSILEYEVVNSIEIRDVHTYKYLMICQEASDRQIFKLKSYLLLYCYNSTSDGSPGDSVILYNSALNDFQQAIFPLQQFNIPDVDYPPNLLLSGYISDGVGKLLVSNSRTFITQYQLNNESMIYWEHPNFKGSVKMRVGFTTNNVLSSTTTAVTFQIRLFDIVTQYLNSIQRSSSLIIVVAVYLLLLSFLISIKYLREDAMMRKDTKRKTFLAAYNLIIKNEQTKQNLIFMRDPRIIDEMRRHIS